MLIECRSFAEEGDPMDWQLLLDCVFARFSDPAGAQIPVLRRPVPKTCLRPLRADFGGFTEPGWLGDPGIRRCIETLHLVADKMSRYKMF
jgi:hypothetical protein